MEGWDSQDSDQNSPAAVFHPADCRDRVHRSGELGVLARENVPIHTIAFRDVQVLPRLDGPQIILALQVVWHALGDLPRETQNGILHLHVCRGCCASSLGRAHGSFVPQRAVRLFATFRGGTSSCRHPACGPRQKTAASGTSRNGRSCCSCREDIRCVNLSCNSDAGTFAISGSRVPDSLSTTKTLHDRIGLQHARVEV